MAISTGSVVLGCSADSRSDDGCSGLFDLRAFGFAWAPSTSANIRLLPPEEGQA
jgi:hypothetical protein